MLSRVGWLGLLALVAGPARATPGGATPGGAASGGAAPGGPAPATLSPPAFPAPGEPEPRVVLVAHPIINLGREDSGRVLRLLAETLGDRQAAVVVGHVPSAERGLPADCASQPDCVRTLAGRLDAAQLVFVVLTRVGERVQVEATWADRSGDRASARDPFSLRWPLDRTDPDLEAGALLLVPRGTLGPRTARRDPSLGVPDQDNPGWFLEPDPRPPTVRPLTWALTGLSGLALAGGLVLVLAGTPSYNDVIGRGCDVSTTRPCEEATADYGRTSTLGVLMFAVAGAAAALALWRLDDDLETAPPEALPTPDFGPTHLGGRF